MNGKLILELLRSIPSLANNKEALNRVLDLVNELKNATPVTTQQPTSGKYLYACVFTLKDGTKHYHPLIGGMYPSNDIEDYKMEAYDSILELQESDASEISYEATKRGYKMVILYVPNDIYEKLEAKLFELVSLVFEAVDEGVKSLSKANSLMGNFVSEGVLKAMLLQQIMSQPSIAGVGLTKENEIINKGDYIDTIPIYEDEYDDEDWED